MCFDHASQIVIDDLRARNAGIRWLVGIHGEDDSTELVEGAARDEFVGAGADRRDRLGLDQVATRIVVVFQRSFRNGLW